MDTLLKNNESQLKSFDKAYKWLHWSMAILVMLMLFAAVGFAPGMSIAEHKEMLTGHSSIGTLVSILLILRVAKRFVKRDPQPVQNIAHWQKLASKAVQLGLYFSLVFVPITGYLTARFHELPVMVFGAFNLNQAGSQGFNQETFDMIRLAHELGTKMIMILLVLHIGGALYHRFVKKDDVLASMTRVKR